ncbi:MAG: dTDP-4-dehydrorhamnose reductase [Spirochaetales bacterium]|nr:dTDP-4-dehydrorhamnose reductase [Spirochaetales bacterium]
MIWIVGNKGMLGTACESLFKKSNVNFVGTDEEIDITSLPALRSYAADNINEKLDWIINCAAYTAVDKAEKEEALAMKINGQGAGNLAEVAAAHRAKLIHISTDYVYDGTKKGAYRESDPVNPVNVYGRTKLAGESLVREKCREHIILRTAWLYGKNGKNFVYTMIRLLNERDKINVVDDQWGSPTYTKDLASCILHIIKKNSRKYGVYHFSNEGRITWFDLAYKIMELGREMGIVRKETTISPVTTDESPTPAKRPANSVLSKEKIKRELGIPIRDWEEALIEFLDHEK